MSLLPLLVLLMAADGDCPGDGTLTDLRAALDASEILAESGNLHGFRGQQGMVRARTRCLDEVVDPGDASRLHALEALAAETRGDGDGAEAAFLAARTWPGHEAPPWLGEEPAAIAQRWAAAGERGPQVWQFHRVTSGHVLYVDGLAALARPVERPALFQVTDPEGAVLWSDLLTGAQPLPSEFAVPAPERIGVHGDDVLAEAVQLLEDGRYDKALELSVPAVSQYPDLAVSFLAVAELAMDQMHRQTYGIQVVEGGSPYTAPIPPPATRTGRRARLGIEVGSPTSLNLEWTARRNDEDPGGWSGLDGWGFRAGIGPLVMWTGSVYGVPWTHVYLDWGSGHDIQLETSAGFIWYTGYPYFSLGGAVQYDPDKPLQVSVGAHICTEGIAPEANVGFLW